MSWDADLLDDRGHYEGSWNYTHNTSRMIYAVLNDAGIVLPDDTAPCITYENGKPVRHPDGYGTIPWWMHLDGMSGPEGGAFLDLIVRGLQADPDRFREMNPENGWGDYDSLLKVLTEMRDRVPEWPSVWSAGG